MKENNKLLYDLFRAYYDARRHKRNTRSQLEFEYHLEDNLTALYHELDNLTYKVGKSICFITDYPVKREVFAAEFRDRVVHHLLCNYIGGILDAVFIADSYSCRKGRGTLYGIKRLEHHVRSCSDNWQRRCYILKLDISGYFMHISRHILYRQVMELLARKLEEKSGLLTGKEKRLVEYLLQEIIFNDPIRKCEVRGKMADWEGLPASKSLFYAPQGCGLPIGNLTSQLFSNLYLNVFDNYMKRTKGLVHYGRYVDDFYVVHHDRQFLASLVPQVRAFLKAELGLDLHMKKIFLQEASKGCVFLGAMVKPYRRHLKKSMKSHIVYELTRVRKEQAVIRQNRPDKHGKRMEHLVSVESSYQGYMLHYCCHKLLTRIYKVPFLPPSYDDLAKNVPISL